TWIVPVLLVAATALLRNRLPALLAGAVIFILALLPVMGFVPFDFQAISSCADHYLYLAMVGPALAVAGLLVTTRRLATRGIAMLMLLAMAVLSYRQTWVWRDDFSLYPHTLSVNPNSFTAHNNFAATLLEHARPGDALPHAQRACELKPRFAPAWINLAD